MFFCSFSLGRCVVLLRYTDSDYPFGIFKLFYGYNNISDILEI